MFELDDETVVAAEHDMCMLIKGGIAAEAVIEALADYGGDVT